MNKIITVATTSTAVVQKPAEPLFISVPPRPQRVLHSEAYIKYVLCTFEIEKVLYFDYSSNKDHPQ